MDPAPPRRHRARQEEPQAPPTMSPAPARSCPLSRPYSQSVCWGARLAAHPMSSLSLSSVLTNHVAAMDLAGPVLTEPVSQLSVAAAARYLFRQVGAGAATVHIAVCHHDSDRLHPGQLAAGGVAPRPHPVSTALRCDHSSHKRYVPTGPAAGAPCCSPRVPGTAVFSIVFGPLQEASRRPPAPSWSAQPQVLVSAAVSVQTDGHEDQLGACRVSDILVSSNQ